MTALFEEVFFVVSNRGSDPNTRISDGVCIYKNVLCIEYEELLYGNDEELHAMVRALTEKLKNRFEYFFKSNSEFFGEDRIAAAAERLNAMARAVANMATEPADKLDLKFLVHGGGHLTGGSEGLGNNANSDTTENQHRRLSIALPGGACKITWPKAAENVQIAYAASYPGKSTDEARYMPLYTSYAHFWCCQDAALE